MHIVPSKSTEVMSFGSPKYLETLKQTHYETANFEKSREKKFKKITNEVRKLSQSIHTHKPLDNDWKAMCLNLQRLAEIAFAEGNTNDDASKDKERTLWDNDCNNGSLNEAVIRLILEEGKLNLLLRLLTNYKAIQYNEGFKVSMEIECNVNKIRMSSLRQLCTIYEESLGILLYFCIQKMDSLQILDIEHLIEYISHILSKKDNVISFDKRQEIFVIYYLYTLSNHLNNIQMEEKVMRFIEKYNVIPKSIEYIMKYHKILSEDVLQKYCLFLSNSFQTESFSAEPTLFIRNYNKTNDDETAKLLCHFYDEYVNKFVRKEKKLTIKQMRGYMKQYHKMKKTL